MRVRPLVVLAAAAMVALLAGCSGSGSAPAATATVAPAAASITVEVTINAAGGATVSPPSLGLANPPERITVQFISRHQPPKGLLGSCPSDYDTVRVNSDPLLMLEPQDACNTYGATTTTLPTVGLNVVQLNGTTVGTFEVTVPTPTGTTPAPKAPTAPTSPAAAPRPNPKCTWNPAAGQYQDKTGKPCGGY